MRFIVTLIGLCLLYFAIIVAFLYIFIKRKEKAVKKEFKEYQVECGTMSEEELLGIEGTEELVETVERRIELKVSAYENLEKGFACLSEPEQTVYVLYDYYDNLFLADFFESDKREICVPRFSECLARVGAYEYQKAFDTLMYEHNVDLFDLSRYAGHGKNKKNKDTNREVFEQFDSMVEDLPMLDEWLAKYIRENISYF